MIDSTACYSKVYCQNSTNLKNNRKIIFQFVENSGNILPRCLIYNFREIYLSIISYKTSFCFHILLLNNVLLKFNKNINLFAELTVIYLLKAPYLQRARVNFYLSVVQRSCFSTTYK